MLTRSVYTVTHLSVTVLLYKLSFCIERLCYVPHFYGQLRSVCILRHVLVLMDSVVLAGQLEESQRLKQLEEQKVLQLTGERHDTLILMQKYQLRCFCLVRVHRYFEYV